MRNQPKVGAKVCLSRKFRASTGARSFTGLVQLCPEVERTFYCGLCSKGTHAYIVGMVDGRTLDKRHVAVANLEKA